MSQSKVTVGLCETQPLVVAGLQTVLREHTAFAMMDSARSLEEAGRQVVAHSPHIFIIDKSVGAPLVAEFITKHRDRVPTAFVVWGPMMTEPEALRFIKVGARGIIRKTADTSSVLACLEAVAAGNTWMEDSLFYGGRRRETGLRSELTVREQQVLELVEQGMRNKDIARELGIQPGTVKIHLKHIFEKTGVRGRYGLALSGLQQRTVDPMVHV